MADDIEAELETQLASQREALAGIDEAIGPGGEEAAGQEGHAELLQLRDELRAAVSELESALLEIKRARILQQLAARNASPGGAPHTADPLPPAPPAHQAVLPATPSPHPTCQPPAGSCCSFRYMDGRWYAGRVQGPGRQAGTVSVTFEVPTRPFMLDPFDVMEALVRPHDGAAAARPASAAAAAASAQAASRGGPSLQGLVSTAHGEVTVGRRALALLPGSRLYVPVEVVALDAVRATANVLPLLPQHDGRRGGGGGGGGGREVVVPLRFVTRHAHVTPPPSAAAAAAAGPGKGGSAGDGMESDGDGGGGSSTSSGSVSALLHPAIGEEDGEGSMDEDGDEDDDDGSDGDEDGAADDDVDEDLYGSDGDAGGSGGARRGGTAASSGAADLGAGDEDEEEAGGLDVFGHARLAAAAGAVDDAALLAEWEAHGRGVASRLLVRMGYVRGQGLGSRGQGTMDAPEVLLLPERKGLGAADKDRVRRVGGSGGISKLKGGVAKKRSRRGGARQKRKRAIESSREARAEAREAEEGGAAGGGGGLFDFINSSLGDSSAAARIRKAQVSVAGVAAGGGGGGGGEAVRTAGAAAIACAVAAASGGGPSRRAPDRRGLMTHHDNVAGIQTKLARLREMLGRHKDNRGLRSQIEAQIGAVQAELAAAQSAAARASKAIHDKDAQKKWLKF